MSEKREKGTGTRLVEAGRRREWTGPVVNPPIWRASTHLFDSDADRRAGGRANADGHFHYGRRGAPTQWALADALTELEPGAHGTMLYPSGTAALAGALLAVLKAGDVLLCTDNVYEPTRAIADDLLARYGIETRYFDPRDLDGFAALFCDRTAAVMLENPGSLTMELCDVPALAAIAREHGAVSLLDNTWAGPLGFPALERGVDITVMSLTKHVGGHSDAMMGSAATGDASLYRKLRHTAQLLGQIVSPDDAALMLRGLRTMGLRLDRTAASGLRIAEWLGGRSEVARVLCPMLPGSADHELWQRDFTGGCGLLSFVLHDRTAQQREAFVDALEMFGIGYSWGGFESLVVPFDPAPIRPASGWPPRHFALEDRLGVRLAIGLEDPDDLIADLDRAFAAMDTP
ncbi:cystathionine beta-lyase [Erythrobacter sp. LQ02-29]|uniref:cystathionine beta-lyase n=1 Tax=Erythrobacter sp. LQ02-29 TaxID=2920384 RepID=UPI001F4F0BB4|nr:cystathionine beta-lyase [Erythrobacter sp. LQ02-29]MCP9222554.1 cystathionine beta-lyase [Erythrobacter sp. LQ02-29]